MRKNKDGTPDKRFKKVDEKPEEKVVEKIVEKLDPNELHAKLLKENNLKLDFDVLDGAITTKHGIIKLEKPTLVIKATYVTNK